MPPLQSVYDGTTKDTEIAQGVTVITTALAADLDIGDEDCSLTDATGAAGRATIVVDDEIIYYHSRLGNAPSTVEGLLRGQDGTVEADHVATAVVTIVSGPRFGNPALIDAVLMMQDHLVDLRSRVTALEAI